MDKIELRKQMKIIRNDIDCAQTKSDLIMSEVIDLINSHRIVKIFSYVSMDSEVDTFKLLEYYINKSNCEVYVPRTKNGIMDLVRLFTLPKNLPDKHGNLACCENISPYVGQVDAAIVPMLAFNKDCYRLGYGGGYYDKFLSQNNVFSIGAAFDEQYCHNFKPDIWDVPLKMIITPTKRYH